jgi:hypothetical protein
VCSIFAASSNAGGSGVVVSPVTTVPIASGFVTVGSPVALSPAAV